MTACMASMRTKAPTESQDGERSLQKRTGNHSGAGLPPGIWHQGESRSPHQVKQCGGDVPQSPLQDSIAENGRVRPSRPGLKVAKIQSSEHKIAPTNLDFSCLPCMADVQAACVWWSCQAFTVSTPGQGGQHLPFDENL